MKIEYNIILNLANENEKLPISLRFRKVLEEIFLEVNEDSFVVKYKQSKYTLNYSCNEIDTQCDDKMCYFIVEYDGGQNKKTAAIMDYFHEKFIENLNSGKDKFNPIILYDEKLPLGYRDIELERKILMNTYKKKGIREGEKKVK